LIRNVYKILQKKLRGKRERRKIFMDIRKKCMNWVSVAQKRAVMGSCEYGNEPSGFHKTQHNFLSSLATSHEGLCSIKCVAASQSRVSILKMCSVIF
jgi:hypothetical protein